MEKFRGGEWREEMNEPVKAETKRNLCVRVNCVCACARVCTCAGVQEIAVFYAKLTFLCHL